MKKCLYALLLSCLLSGASAQSLYFPPVSGNNWDTLSPATLGWCPSRIDSLYNFLQEKNTDAFIVLVNGRIVMEKYFGTYTKDSLHYWASAGKSLTSVLTGIAQDKGFLQLEDTVSEHLGAGWTAAPPAKEKKITIRHLLSMTSGLDDNPSGGCTSDDTNAACLQYLTDAGTRWAYHNGAYKKLQAVISTASGMGYNAFTFQHLGAHIGMPGLWVDGTFYSNARRMARFGLLMLNNGIWGTDTVLKDAAFVQAMKHTSQPFNAAYGYLWWLNGRSSFMLPTLQATFPGAIIPDAPADLFCALGKDDQKIYVVPSRNMVVIRQGASAGTTPLLALSSFDNELWRRLDSLSCATVSVGTQSKTAPLVVYPNPAGPEVRISWSQDIREVTLTDLSGRTVLRRRPGAPTSSYTLSVSHLPAGTYLLQLKATDGTRATGRFCKD